MVRVIGLGKNTASPLLTLTPPPDPPPIRSLGNGDSSYWPTAIQLKQGYYTTQKLTFITNEIDLVMAAIAFINTPSYFCLLELLVSYHHHVSDISHCTSILCEPHKGVSYCKAVIWVFESLSMLGKLPADLWPGACGLGGWSVCFWGALRYLC